MLSKPEFLKEYRICAWPSMNGGILCDMDCRTVASPVSRVQTSWFCVDVYSLRFGRADCWHMPLKFPCASVGSCCRPDPQLTDCRYTRLHLQRSAYPCNEWWMGTVAQPFYRTEGCSPVAVEVICLCRVVVLNIARFRLSRNNVIIVLDCGTVAQLWTLERVRPDRVSAIRPPCIPFGNTTSHTNASTMI